MALLKRANDQQQSEWRPVPIGVWRWRINPAPELKFSEKFGNYGVQFPLLLIPDELDRLLEEEGKPPEGVQQSTRVQYRTGLSLGFKQKDGQYKSTKLVDMLAACLGQQNQKKFFEWIVDGGGPPKIPDPDNQDAELEGIRKWLGWWEDLEVLGSVRHEEDSQNSNVIWARFAGPIAIGSLPKERDDNYQAIGRAKLRSMIAEYEASLEQPRRRSEPALARTPKKYEDVFDDEPEDKKSLPF